jgi:hypothetical protein
MSMAVHPGDAQGFIFICLADGKVSIIQPFLASFRVYLCLECHFNGCGDGS